jgi:hypothetical protein
MLSADPELQETCGTRARMIHRILHNIAPSHLKGTSTALEYMNFYQKERPGCPRAPQEQLEVRHFTFFINYLEKYNLKPCPL